MDIPAWIWPLAVAPIIGSFLGAVIKRVEDPRSIMFGRSRCESCGAKLRSENVRFLEQEYRIGDTRAVMIEGPSREAIEIVEIK